MDQHPHSDLAEMPIYDLNNEMDYLIEYIDKMCQELKPIKTPYLTNISPRKRCDDISIAWDRLLACFDEANARRNDP